MAKPTWISTQSPGTGNCSSNSPRSTLRRTPTTSTTARCAFCASSSTIFPGIAKHTLQLLLTSDLCGDLLSSGLFLRPGHQLKAELQLILQPQGSPRKRKRLDRIIRLPQRKLPGNPQHRSQVRHPRFHGLGLRHSVKRQLSLYACEQQPARQLFHSYLFAFIDRFREARDLQNFFIHRLFKLPAVVALHFVLNFHCAGTHDRAHERLLISSGDTLDHPVEVAYGDPGVMSECGKQSSGKCLHSETASSGINQIFHWRKSSLYSALHDSFPCPGILRATGRRRSEARSKMFFRFRQPRTQRRSACPLDRWYKLTPFRGGLGLVRFPLAGAYMERRRK